MTSITTAQRLVDEIDEKFAIGWPNLSVRDRRVLAMLAAAKYTLENDLTSDAMDYISIAMQTLVGEEETLQ